MFLNPPPAPSISPIFIKQIRISLQSFITRMHGFNIRIFLMPQHCRRPRRFSPVRSETPPLWLSSLLLSHLQLHPLGSDLLTCLPLHKLLLDKYVCRCRCWHLTSKCPRCHQGWREHKLSQVERRRRLRWLTGENNASICWALYGCFVDGTCWTATQRLWLGSFT